LFVFTFQSTETFVLASAGASIWFVPERVTFPLWSSYFRTDSSGELTGHGDLKTGLPSWKGPTPESASSRVHLRAPEVVPERLRSGRQRPL
jgi:hypothetical protein